MRKRWRIGLELTAVSVLVGYVFFKEPLQHLYAKHVIRNQHIVVSLTTTPKRLHNLQETLESLFRQSAKIDTIYLSLPHVFKRDNSTYEIPEWIANEPRIKILRTKDYGPATKVLGLLEQVKFADDTIIISVDDDVIYPKHTVLELAYSSTLYPQNTASATAMHMKVVPANIKRDFDYRYILNGVTGVAYRSRFFEDDIFAIENDYPECFRADDIYFSFFMAKYGHPIYKIAPISKGLVNDLYVGLHTERGTDAEALHLQWPPPAVKNQLCANVLKHRFPEVEFDVSF